MQHCPVSFSPEASDRWVLLYRAAWEQQLQHLPLQEVPQHVRGAEAHWPVQVWKQNRTGSEGHSLSSHVCQVLIGDPIKRYWCLRWRCDGSGDNDPSTLPKPAVTLDCFNLTVNIILSFYLKHICWYSALLWNRATFQTWLLQDFTVDQLTASLEQLEPSAPLSYPSNERFPCFSSNALPFVAEWWKALGS